MISKKISDTLSLVSNENSSVSHLQQIYIANEIWKDIPEILSSIFYFG